MPEVIGGGGVKLHVREGGTATGMPLLFIHGYCQSAGSWDRQFSSERLRKFRLLGMDLRGHGGSEKPQDPAAFKDSQLWADDLGSVLAHAGPRPVTVVAWSYAGRVVGDYLRAYGTELLSAIVFVGAVTRTGNRYSAPTFNALFPDVFSDDPATLEPVLRRFVELCFARGFALDERVAAKILAAEKVVPRVAREAMLKRGKLDYDDVLRSVDIPVLCVHGTADDVILPSSSEHIVGLVPNARIARYTGVGHSPFFEAPLRFNRELAELAELASLQRNLQ